MTAIDMFHDCTDRFGQIFVDTVLCSQRNHRCRGCRHAGRSIAAQGWPWAAWLPLKVSYLAIARRTDHSLPVSGGPALWTVDEGARES
jgi:hypothetical protein